MRGSILHPGPRRDLAQGSTTQVPASHSSDQHLGTSDKMLENILPPLQCLFNKQAANYRMVWLKSIHLPKSLHEKDSFWHILILMKIQETQTVSPAFIWVTFTKCSRGVEHPYEQYQKLISASPLKSKEIFFLFCLSSWQDFVNRLPEAFKAFSTLQKHLSHFPSVLPIVANEDR